MRTQHRLSPDALRTGTIIKNLLIMEEKRMNELGLKELNSSELQTAGGISFTDALRFAEQIRTIIYFIGEYVPELIRGFKDGVLKQAVLR